MSVMLVAIVAHTDGFHIPSERVTNMKGGWTAMHLSWTTATDDLVTRITSFRRRMHCRGTGSSARQDHTGHGNKLSIAQHLRPPGTSFLQQSDNHEEVDHQLEAPRAFRPHDLSDTNLQKAERPERSYPAQPTRPSNIKFPASRMVNPSTDTLLPAVEGPSQSVSSPVLEKTPDLPLETTAHADVDTKAELVAVKKGHAGSEGPKPSGLPRKVSHKSRKPLKKKEEVPVYSSSSDSSDDDFDSDFDSESESSDDEKALKIMRKRRKAAKKKKRRTSVSSESEADESEEEKPKKESSDKLEKRKKKRTKKADHKPKPSSDTNASSSDEDAAKSSKRGEKAAEKKFKDTRKASKSRKRSLQDVYKRVDEVWNKQDRRTTLRPTVKDDDDDFAEHTFLVRRTFTFKNEYLQTMIDIKSRALRSVLREVLKDCKEANLDVEEPELCDRTLFYYLEDLRTYCRTTMGTRLESERKRKVVKQLRIQRHLCKALVHYLDEDF
ncbi:hypothetical protein LTR35_011041 [Friedmanniomyces endolithicus]|nr:hypothetical protein LTR35_011041 [Friedmanniomyces endolithicus]KAK0293976.1 hypothetical protein LTS00_007315 [Friedmanniomyces endolithicus]KAK0992010.1 hypothetical protein LTR54_011516 [Friedmanniomyces endolithicus]